MAYDVTRLPSGADDPAGAAGEVHGRAELLNGPDWPYRLTRQGVEWRDDSGDAPEWRRLCARLEVIADTRDGGSENWGRLLAFEDRDGVRHEWAAPMAEIAKANSGDVVAHLAALGLEVPTAGRDKVRLLEYIAQAKPRARFRCVSRVGWESGVFVLPGESFGETAGERILFQPDGVGFDHAYRVRGTLAEWQGRIGTAAVGNSRLAFAVSAAFGGPILDLLGEESGGFHLRGGSSLGKSTALYVAGSVWGGGDVRGYVQTWRATDNGLEATAARHCDTFLALDELGQADARTAAETAYMLANGQGKARTTRIGAGRRTAAWRVLFLSTGEISLADKIGEDGRGRRAKAGQEVRVIDIPADAGAGHGLFEALHDAPGAAAFAKQLKRAAAECYGEPARAFLAWLTANREKAAEGARTLRDRFLGSLSLADASGQVERAAGRFALVAAAGELASFAGILPWPPGEAERAARLCFDAWLAGRGGAEPAEVREGIATVRAFMEREGASRFQEWHGADERVPYRVGFWRLADDGGGREYFLLPEAFKREVANGFDARQLAGAMVERGLILPGPDGRPAVSLRVPALGKTARLYHLSPAIFEDDGDGRA